MKHLGAVAVVAAAFAFSTAALASTPTVFIDGQKLNSDVPAIEIGDRVLVPLRAIAERLGAFVDYDPESQDVTVELGDRVVMLTIGSRQAFLNGKPLMLDVAAQTFAGRTEVPLRFVGQALGAAVDYNTETDTAAVVTGHPQGNFVAAISGPQFAAGYSGSGQRSTPPSVQDKRPAPDSLVGSAYPEIYARFVGGSSAIDPGSVQVALDGRDVTSDATVSSAYVSLTPSQRLTTGSHSVEVSGRTDDGAPFDEQWSFRVDAGYGASDVSSIIDYAPGPYGYRNFGFYPPGFSVFVPGPMYFVAGNFIEIVFYSPFFPYGSGFFTVGGLPGTFPFQPWFGYPGYFWATVPVPFGVNAPAAAVAAHYDTFTGQHVVVNATAPLHIDGTRKTLPGSLRFANEPFVISHPTSPHHLIVFRRVLPPTFVHVNRPNAGSSGSSYIRIEPMTVHVINGGNSNSTQPVMHVKTPAPAPAPVILKPVKVHPGNGGPNHGATPQPVGVATPTPHP